MANDARTALALALVGGAGLAALVFIRSRSQGSADGGAAADELAPSSQDTTPQGEFFVPNFLNTPILQGVTPLYTARGLRNNNPGNIRWNVANDWQGQAGADDQGYAIFVNMHSGVRALVRVLDNYRRQGRDTVAAIIAKWAPLGDGNDTAAYTAHVAGQLGVGANTVIDISDVGTMLALVHAITLHENGSDPLDNQLILESINDARA